MRKAGWLLLGSLMGGATGVLGEVRTTSELGLAAKADTASATSYVQVTLEDFGSRPGTIITCADLCFRVPSQGGKEMELWLVTPERERPWATATVRDLRKLRRVGFVSEDGEGMVRFDLTDLLQGWSVAERGAPVFYLRLRGDESIESIVPERVVRGELVLHTQNARGQ